MFYLKYYFFLGWVNSLTKQISKHQKYFTLSLFLLFLILLLLEQNTTKQQNKSQN